MAKLIYPTTRKVAPPLLVSAEQLEQLDAIIDENINGLRQERDKQLVAMVEAEIAKDQSRGRLKAEDVEARRARALKFWKASNTWSEEKRTITIFLSKGRQVEVERFSEAIAHTQSQDEIPLGFLLFVRVGKLTVKIDLNGAWNDKLVVTVEPSEWEKSQEIFGQLANWARDVEPPTWQKRWLEFRGVFMVLFFTLLLFGFFLVPLLNWGSGAKDSQKEEARKLLAQGINTGNQQHALELLLAIESDYSPATAQKQSMGIKYWSYVLLAAVFLLIASISPGEVLGFWKGRDKLERWQLRIRIVTVSIPTLLITFVAIPWLLYWFHLVPPNP